LGLCCLFIEQLKKEEDEKISERLATVAAPPQPQNQMEILQKIESGEISVKEALKEMNS